MGQSLVKNYVHIVFSTKYRQPLIFPWVEDALFGYMGAICNDLECHVIKIGGYLDHVHILCMLSKKIALAKLLEDLKSNSSRWVKTQGEGLENFYWQTGYATFSVDYRGVEKVAAYIARQKEHHGGTQFQEELRTLFKENDMEYDERYVWD